MPVAFAKLRPKARPIAVVLGVIVVGSGLAVASKSDIARFQADADRMRTLERAPLFPVGTVSMADRDWPQWRGPRRDGISFDTAISFNWLPAGPPTRWEKPIGRGFSAPVVCERRVYTMVQDEESGSEHQPCEGIICWDADTGAERWRFCYPGGYEERMGAGPRSTPLLAQGLVYAVGPTGVFHCLRADSGEKVWRHDLLEEFHAQRPRYGVSFSPLLDGELVFALPGGREGGSVAAFNARTGQLVWQALDDEAGYSSPVCATLAGVRQLLVLTNEALVSLSPADGRIYWRHPWLTKDGFNIATPLTFDNYVFISSAYGKGCALLQVSADEEGQLSAKQVYAHNRMRNYFASSVQFGAHIYGFDNSDLVCMEIRTGNVLWRERGFRKGSLMIANGHLLVLGENGRLAVAKAIPGEYREIGSIQVSRNKCWTVPVLAGGNLYVRDENHLRCLNLRQ
jgi:outer membrane protein assembly factor BamB